MIEHEGTKHISFQRLHGWNIKHESLGLGGRSKDDSNTVFERHESCDKC